MTEKLQNITNQNEVQKESQSLFIKLEEQTKNLTSALKNEKKMQILESMGFVIPKAERIRHYANYVLETIEKEPEETKLTKILNILEKDGIFTKEELEILIIEKQAIEKGGISQKEEKEIENLIEKDKKNNNSINKQWFKKIILLGALLLAPLYNKNKESNNKEKIQNKTNIETPAIKKYIDSSKTGTLSENEIEKIPVEVEKYIEVIKNLEFIKGNFYVLDKSDKKNPTLYETTKEGKVISKAIVGIGKEGHETKEGIYMFSKWLMQKDIDLYGEDGVLRLLGYSVDGEIVDNMGVHRIYPLEEKERTAKMLNKNAEKDISLSCINVFSNYFKQHILEDYDKQGGEGRLIIAIMQEKNNFDAKGWKNITQKIQKDVESLEQISNE